MKKGKEYESFVFKIFSELFKGFTLRKNERIRGKISGVLREIDITIRGKVDDIDLLYLVQAKDYTRPATITVIDAFSSVITEVGASKGLLVCSSGFAKTNYEYARTLGIELLSVEDIKSKKWKANVEIPIIYVSYDINYNIQIPIETSMLNELKNINREDKFNFSIDGGKTFLHIKDHITNLIKQGKVSFSDKRKIIFEPPLRLLKFSTFEFPRASLITEPKKKLFLKYIVPNKYRGIKDYLNKTFIPTTFEISDISLQLDSSFIPIDENQIPIHPTGFSITVETTFSEQPKQSEETIKQQ